MEDINLVQIGQVVRGLKMAIPVNNTPVCRTSLLGTNTTVCLNIANFCIVCFLHYISIHNNYSK